MNGRMISPGKCRGNAIVSKEPIGFLLMKRQKQ